MVQTIKPRNMHKNITLKAYKSNMGTKHNIYWMTSTIYRKSKPSLSYELETKIHQNHSVSNP